MPFREQYIEFDVTEDQVLVGVPVGIEVQLYQNSSQYPIIYTINTFEDNLAPLIYRFYYSLDNGVTWIEYPSGESGQTFYQAFKMRIEVNANNCSFILLESAGKVYRYVPLFSSTPYETDLNDEIIDCSVDTKNNIAYFSSSSTIYRVNVNGDNWFQNALNVQNDGIIGTIVDAERQSFWQINENTICLKNLYGEEIFCLDIELESMDIDYSSSSSSSIDSSSSSSMIYSSSTSSELYSESSSSELYSESSSSGLYSSSTSSELYSESSSSEIYSSSTSSGLYSESSSSEIYSSSTSSELYSESSSSGMAGSESSSSVDIPYTGPTLWFDAENVTLDGTEITEFIDKVNGFVWQLASVSFIGGTQITNELNGHSVLRKASGSSAYRYASYDDVADMGPFTGTQIVVVKGGGEANRNCIWGGLENDTFEVTNTNWAILSQINVWKVDGALRGSICGHYSGSTTDTYVGDFAELMLYNRILQPNELQDAINYLSNKYNISTVVTASTSSSSSS